MNSLTYLSRQFDVLASARTPPSTPLAESVRLLSDVEQDSASTLKRVSTWSTKSFLPVPSTSSSGSWTLKRSYSSPADVHPGAPSPPHTTPRRLSVPSARRSSTSAARRPSLPTSDKATRPKSSSESLLHRVFFVRVLLSFWNYVYNLWVSLTRQTRAHDVVAEEGTDEDEKDTEDEGKDEAVTRMDVRMSPPLQPPVPPPLFVVSGAVSYYPDDSKTDAENSSTAATVTTPPAVQSGNGAREATPPSQAQKRGLHRQKTLVLDLDETLIHSTSRPMHSPPGGGLLSTFGFGRRNKGAGHTVEVVLGGRSTIYHVYKRPFVDYFLRKVSAWYTLVIFTASMQEYADPVIDWLDAGRGILEKRFFRESCTQLPNGSYTKDLSVVEQDLALVCLVDNSPVCYTINEANGIPIEGWTHDPHDEALLDLLPVLDSLRFTSDVRRVLGIRGFS